MDHSRVPGKSFQIFGVPPASSHASMMERDEDTNCKHLRPALGMLIRQVEEGTESCIVLVNEISVAALSSRALSVLL